MRQSTMPAIELRGIFKRFGDVAAVAGVDLQLVAGQRLALLGRSGAGKTSLLRIVAGLEPPDAGSVWLAGRDATRLAPNARDLAYLTQDYALYPQMSVYRNLEAGLASLRLSSQIREERIQETLDWFHLADLRNRLPSELSGGQAQRVAFAKAVVRQPGILLLDEPLSQVDARLRAQTR